ncbi:MAG: IreB family regulatory phosphoprotein [Clostridia bacterium]|nr:IreB family regulatory phosphoprotein [Clostridia bacterium]
MNENGKFSKKDSSKTQTFNFVEERDLQLKQIMQQTYSALSEKGYNPVNQIVGYILSEDPTYITNYKGARTLISKIDRDELLNSLVRNYLNL